LKKHVTIKELERDDVESMAGWGTHDDPLFLHYNFPKISHGERGLWYHMKTSGIRKKCFAAINQENDVIGYISMKRINYFRRISQLGIVLDPARIGQGYGTIALKSFMEMYFGKMKMEKLCLKVAKFNERAFKTYLKSGFIIENEIVEVFEEQEIEEELIREIMKDNPYIFYENGQIFCQYYSMSISKESWFSPQKE
jgi:RimJ/RimL family protein N-acetyltransferase